MKRRGKTAEELIAELEADPAWRAKRARIERETQDRATRLMAEEAPLVRDLQSAGVHVTSAWDLVNTHASYPSAIPVVLEHFQRPYSAVIREGIARALAVKEAAWAWDVLLEYFSREPEGGKTDVKWALACALSGASTDERLDKIIELLMDQSIGLNRFALLGALGRSKTQRARAAIQKLRADPQIGREIRRLFGRPKK